MFGFSTTSHAQAQGVDDAAGVPVRIYGKGTYTIYGGSPVAGTLRIKLPNDSLTVAIDQSTSIPNTTGGTTGNILTAKLMPGKSYTGKSYPV